jgi:hypothetical protein
MYKSDYDAFVSNPVWKEIVSDIKETIVGLYSDIRELDPHMEPTALARQQGRLAMAEFMLALPDDILREINTKLEEKTEEENEG